MVDNWNLDYAAIALVVSAVALFGLYQVPHLHRLNPGWVALLVTLVVVFKRDASVWLVLAVLVLWFVRDVAPLPVQVALVAAGAGATAMELYGEGTNLPWVLLLAVPAVGAAMVRAGKTIDDETVWILLVVTIAGQWAGAPDTEGTVVALVVVGLFAVDAIRSGAHVIPASWWPLIAAVLWASAYGSLGRQSAMAGCIACFGVLLAEPIRSWIAEAITRGDTRNSSRRGRLRPATTGSGSRPWGSCCSSRCPRFSSLLGVAAASSSPEVAVGVSLAVILLDVIALEVARRQLANQRVPLSARERQGERPVVMHVTTVAMSLELLLGPQLEAFADAGYRVIGASAADEYVPAVEARGVEHVALRHATRAWAPAGDLRLVRELYELFREVRPDIVHTHNPKPGVLGRIAAGAARVPVVVNTVHGLYALPEDRLAKRGVVYGLERLAAFASDAELVQNPEDIPVLRKLGIPAHKITLLGNGVDLNRFGPDSESREAVRAELGFGPDDVVFGVVGRLVAEKGFVELFEVVDRLAASHPSVRWMVVGPDDPDKSDALDRGLVRQAEAEGVCFLGSRTAMERIYPAMDVFVLPSHREGFSRSGMEAAACGLPIITTDVRGCRQVVRDGETGLLVPVRDPDLLRAAVIALANDLDRRATMGEAARALAEKEFDQQRQVEITLETYARLGVSPGAGP